MGNDCAQKETTAATRLCAYQRGLSTEVTRWILEKQKRPLCPNTLFLKYKLVNTGSLEDTILSKYYTKNFSFSIEKI